MTTQQVAELLNASRAEDAMGCRARDEERRRQILDELTAEAEHGLGY